MEIRERLYAEADEGYREFNSKLTPGCGSIIGVRMPILRRIAKEVLKGDWRAFLDEPGPYMQEEKLLRGLVIADAPMETDERISYLREHIEQIDNWAVCDSLVIRREKDREALWDLALEYIDRPGEYEKRFAVVTMMRMIDEEHIDRIIDEFMRVRHDGYYLKMGVAWGLAECYLRFPERTLSALKDCDLDDFTFNKTLQKITESYRADADTKTMIKGMKRR
ncbi:MAG: DNA alkylation repair protein [Candidatus Methanomethylophilaceae archaeon]